MSLTEHRPRSVTELVDVAVRLVARHYAAFLALTCIIFAPVIILALAAVVYAKMQSPGAIALLVIVGLIFIPWFLIVDAAILSAASDAYLGRGVVIGRALRSALSRAGSIFAATVVKFLLIFAGMLPVIFASSVGRALGGGVIFLGVLVTMAWIIYVAVRLFAVPGAVVYENVDYSTALERSRTLSRGAVGQIIGAMLLIYVIVIGVQLAVLTVVSLAVSGEVASLVAQFAGIFTYPLTGTITTLLYYDQRVRKEGFDMELAAAALSEEQGLGATNRG